MDFKITEHVRNSMVVHLTQTRNLPFTYVEITNILQNITPIAAPEQPAKPAPATAPEKEKQKAA